MEYKDAVSAALDIRDCKVVPYFGGFLRDIRSVMSSPSIVVLPSSGVDHSLEVSNQEVFKRIICNTSYSHVIPKHFCLTTYFVTRVTVFVIKAYSLNTLKSYMIRGCFCHK